MWALLAIVGITPGMQGFDPAAAVQELEAARNQKITAAVKANRSADFAKFDKELVEAAKLKLSGVDFRKVDDKRGLDWAALCTLAEKNFEAKSLILRYLKLDLTASQKFSGQMALCDNAVKLDDGKTLFQTLQLVQPTNRVQAVWLGSITGGTFHYWVRESEGPSGAIQIIRRVKAMQPAAPFKTDQERKDAGWAKRQLADCESAYLAEQGRTEDAIKVLDEAIATLDKDIFRVSELKESRERIVMLGKPAPALPVTGSHGAFAGLDSMKGKVVLIEYTAHWCHACHEALPSIRKLADELKGKDFQILSVTTYYGHFLAERAKEKDMSRQQEFEKMPALMKELGIGWPMLYVERETMDNWGVNGIPEFVVVDKQGKVQMIDLGFSASKFGRLRDKILGLLGQH